MKKTIVMASLVAASTSMMAMDLQYFLGAGAERANVNFKASGADGFNEKIVFCELRVCDHHCLMRISSGLRTRMGILSGYSRTTNSHRAGLTE